MHQELVWFDTLCASSRKREKPPRRLLFYAVLCFFSLNVMYIRAPAKERQHQKLFES
jgi:hypothetical protein